MATDATRDETRLAAIADPEPSAIGRADSGETILERLALWLADVSAEAGLQDRLSNREAESDAEPAA